VANQDRLLTAKDVAEQLQITEAWVQQQAREGDLPSISLGRYRRFRASDLQTWLDSKQSNGRRS
jgi:excisionase family DNA binding protein